LQRSSKVNKKEGFSTVTGSHMNTRHGQKQRGRVTLIIKYKKLTQTAHVNKL